MTGHYDPILVSFSLLLSVLASWVALDFSGRVHLQSRRHRRSLWLCAGSLAMGFGIWSMHYVGMLAYRMDMPVLYDWPTVLVSMLAAVAASGIALWTISRNAMSWRSTLLGSLFMGGGIASMHYLGMAAMRMPALTLYSLPVVLLSIGVAVCISAAGLRLTFGQKTINVGWSVKKAGSALLLGLAIPSMHFIGMAAASRAAVPSAGTLGGLEHAVPISTLSTVGIILVSALVLSIALLSASIDRKVSSFQSALHGSKWSNVQLHAHNERLQGAFRAGGVGIWECDPETQLFYVDPNLRELYGLALDDAPLPRATWKASVHPEDAAGLDQRWAESLAGQDRYESEYRILRPDGEIRRVRSVASLLRSDQGILTRVLGMTWDVTSERRREQEVIEQSTLFRTTLEAIGDAVVSIDGQHRVLFLNRAASQLTGWEIEESIGRNLEEVFITRDEQTNAPRRNPVQRCLESGGTFLSEDGILVGRGGTCYNIRKHVALMEDGSGAVLTFQDITEARRLEKELLYSATHDSLTGLANREAFEKKLEALWEETRYSARTHCLCILDLDRFKIINDTSGHLAGDALLREVVRVLHGALRPNDFSARMGGDEFMMLLSDTRSEEGATCMARLLKSISDLRFHWQERWYDVTASIGVVSFDCFSPGPEVLVSQADVALIAAKCNGRNQVSTYKEDGGDAAGHHREMQVVAGLRRNLEEGKFELHAQPIVPSNALESARYFELLIRLRGENGEIIPPGIFIPAAERYGLMPSIDRWVIRTAFDLYRKFAADLEGYRFAINLGADSLSEPFLWTYVTQEFQRTGVPPGSITFEVTETGLIRNLQHAADFMNKAREAGSLIALDDFGTGLSSLAYLKQFPLDTIKIDGTFIHGLRESHQDQAIVRSVAQIARSLGASTVAECVEDLDTVEVLRTLGVDYIQGWATGRPVRLEGLLETIRDNAGPADTPHDGPFLVQARVA